MIDAETFALVGRSGPIGNWISLSAEAVAALKNSSRMALVAVGRHPIVKPEVVAYSGARQAVEYVARMCKTKPARDPSRGEED
jgi:hypothetical protein